MHLYQVLKIGLLFSIILLVTSSSNLSYSRELNPNSTNNNPIGDNCTFKGKKLFGKIQFVTSFPDIKIQVVESFADINVKMVNSFPDECGKWQAVTSFPDLKVQIVTSFPDIKVKFVESFPGKSK